MPIFYFILFIYFFRYILFMSTLHLAYSFSIQFLHQVAFSMMHLWVCYKKCTVLYWAMK